MTRTVRVLHAVAPALVLGSTQPAGDVDAAAARAAGVDVVRRRSGGGAVLVGPGGVLWVDVLLPVGDPLWEDDVGRAAWWVGETWASALEAAGAGEATVWRDGARRTQWSAKVCFGGVGPGEVLVGGRKVVGVSQRRTRRGALFQTAVLLRWDPGEILGLLALPENVRRRGADALRAAAGGVGAGRAGRVEHAFLAALMP